MSPNPPLPEGMAAQTAAVPGFGVQGYGAQARQSPGPGEGGPPRRAALDLAREPPDPRLIRDFGAEQCLMRGAVPWRRVGGGTVIACADPRRFAALRTVLPAHFGRAILAPVARPQIEQAVLLARGQALANAAEHRVPEPESCRHWLTGTPQRWLLAGLAALALGALAAPLAVLGGLTVVAMAFLLAGLALRLIAAFAALRGGLPAVPPPQAAAPMDGATGPLARVSLLVPLYREAEMVPGLLYRLGALDYPRNRLEVLLITEADDHETAAMIAQVDLPPWARHVSVPRGQVQTKPRALNFALGLCRGEIVGIYDAENAPARDQLLRMVQRFRAAGPELACLQSVLDFFNARESWRARLFAAEYAVWFRLLLPGLARLGLAFPLGGTSVFFRRAALEAIGGWDAHNVTEDADLGYRLARHGYRAEMLASVTEEEANTRLWPWVRQRSRWLKGYALTCSTLWRAPRRSLRGLGPANFVVAHVLMLGTLVQFALMPVLWSLWLVALGMPHPLGPGWLGAQTVLTFAVLCILAEALNLVLGIVALRAAGKGRLAFWLPTMIVYFPPAVLAAWKAIGELAFRPFFWDKTRHGLSPLPGDPRLDFDAGRDRGGHAPVRRFRRSG